MSDSQVLVGGGHVGELVLLGAATGQLIPMLVAVLAAVLEPHLRSPDLQRTCCCLFPLAIAPRCTGKSAPERRRSSIIAASIRGCALARLGRIAEHIWEARL